MNHHVSVASSSTDVLAVANVPVLWILALGIFTVIITQTVLYVRAARRVAPTVGMTPQELRTSFRVGAVASLGPSLAVALVAVALLAVFGTPATLMRIGLIGAVQFETGAAAVSAGTMDAELGGPTYTQEVFAVAFMAMSLGGAMWIISTLVLTPLLKRGDAKIKRLNPAAVTIIPSAALLGAFFALGFAELPKSGYHVVAFFSSAAAGAVFLSLSKALNQPWIREWSLGFALLIGICATYLSINADLLGAA